MAIRHENFIWLLIQEGHQKEAEILIIITLPTLWFLKGGWGGRGGGGGGIMIGRNSIAKIFSELNEKISPENLLYHYRESLKNEMISLSYDVNDHVFSKSNSV